MSRVAVVGWADPNPPTPPAPPIVPLAVVTNRIIASGALATVVAALAEAPDVRDRLMSLQEGIYPDDAQAREFLTACGADPDAILALPE